MQCVRAEVGGTAGWGSSSSISLCDWISRGCSWEAANCCPDLAGKTAAGFSGPTQHCQLWFDPGTVPVSHSDCSTCCATHGHIDLDVTHTCIYVLIVKWCLRLFCFALFWIFIPPNYILMLTKHWAVQQVQQVKYNIQELALSVENTSSVLTCYFFFTVFLQELLWNSLLN